MEFRPRQKRLAMSGSQFVWNMGVFSGTFLQAGVTPIPLPAGWLLVEGERRVMLLELSCCQVTARDSRPPDMDWLGHDTSSYP